MRKTVYICILVWLGVISVLAQENQSLLRRIQSNLSQLGRYRVEFRVAVEGYKASGEYVVDGRDFYMSSDSVALYVSSGVKREVNMRKREVTVDSAANLGSDLISNPIDAFLALERDFEAVAVEGVTESVELRERGSNSGDVIRVETDKSGRFPQRIVYRSGGASLSIELLSVKPYAEPLPQYSEADYAGYEVVDFRQ